MEQNENQFDDIDRRKLAFLIGGILVILLAVILVIYLFTDKTKASTGDGDAVLITPDRIQRISDDVSKQVLDTLGTDVLADMVGESVLKELTRDKIYEAIVSDKEGMRDFIAELLKEQGISGGVLTDGQKEYIQDAVRKALQVSLTDISVSQFLTDEEKRRLEEQLKKELADTVRSQIQNSSYQLTAQELEKLKKALDLESLINGKVDTVTKQQLDKLKSDILADLKKSIKTPVKGVDYFTEADIKSIQKKVLSEANKEMLKQIQSLTAKINEVKSSVSTLTKQIKDLEKLDKEKSADIKELKSSVTEINSSIQHINSVTEMLAESITVSGSNLEKVTGSGSEIRSSKVSTGNMTIAEFVDILAGNDNVYTGAIQELNKIIKQLKEENAKQDESFDKSIKELEGSLDDNGKQLEDARAALEKSDQEIKDQLGKQSDDFGKKLDTEQKEREEADSRLQEQADAANGLIGDPKDADHAKGDTIFQKIGEIVKILSTDGMEGLLSALQGIGGAKTVEEGMENLNTDLLDARARVSELEKEKWLSGVILLAEGQADGPAGYACQESGSAYVYQIPLVTEKDGIDLSADDTSIVVQFKQPGRLPSNVAMSTAGNDLLLTFTNRPTRNIDITEIHVYKEKQE